MTTNINVGSTSATAPSPPPAGLHHLRDFKVHRVLSDGSSGPDAASKGVVLYGELQGVDCVVKLKQTPLPTSVSALAALLSRTSLTTRLPYSGAEFGYYRGALSGYDTTTSPAPAAKPEDDSDTVAMQVEVICAGLLPETAMSKDAGETLMRKHIARATAQEPRLFRESAQDYTSRHLPHIESIPPAATAWVDKVLSLEKEKESMLFNDPEFLINIDPKWDAHPKVVEGRSEKKNEDEEEKLDFSKRLYCLGIARDKSLRSLRDLRNKHLPMLKRLRDAGAHIADGYGVGASQLRVFVHYPPQFYHFHVHFTHINVSFGVNTERAHLLDDVIDNIERDANFYATANLTCCMGESDKLWARFCYR